MYVQETNLRLFWEAYLPDSSHSPLNKSWFGFKEIWICQKHYEIMCLCLPGSIYTWNPNDPCFAWKGPCFGGFKPQNRGQTGSRYVYILFFFTSASSRTQGPTHTHTYRNRLRLQSQAVPIFLVKPGGDLVSQIRLAHLWRKSSTIHDAGSTARFLGVHVEVYFEDRNGSCWENLVENRSIACDSMWLIYD